MGDFSGSRQQAFEETYNILEEIGAGSGGTVKKAYHKHLQKYVVLKKMHASAAKVLNIRAEADALKNLRHPYIPQVIDFIELEDGIYTVMDYIPGDTFKKLLGRGQSFTQKEALKYAVQLFEVLEYIHSRNPKVIHGDIKPDNLILTPDGNICLIDFNISGMAEGGATVIEGYTEGYASPEQVESFKANRAAKAQKNMASSGQGVTPGQSFDDDATEIDSDVTEVAYDATEIDPDVTEVATDISIGGSNAGGRNPGETVQGSSEPVSVIGIDERADIYSAAATIYHILTGKKPSLQDGHVIPPAQIRTDVSEGLNFILCHALEQDREKRYQTAIDALNSLKNIGKLDSRYKKLVRRQNTLFIVSVALICAGVFLISTGMNIISKEKLARYDENIVAMSELVGVAGSEEEFDRLYEECIALNDKRIDAYLANAKMLCAAGRYEEAANYIENTLRTNSGFASLSDSGELYYILGSSYYRMEVPNYDEAIKELNNALLAGYKEDRCYRELAECYIAVGDVAKAKEILHTAKENGAVSDDMVLLDGEIYFAEENYAEASKEYRDCIAVSEDDEVLLRAYLGLNKAVLAEDKNSETLMEAISILDEAQRAVSPVQQLQILQSQVQNYIDIFSITGDNQYAEAGIATIQKAVDSGWGNIGNSLNEAFLYQQMGEFDKAEAVLKGLLDDYPDNYQVYKRLAFLEVGWQKAKASGERSYSRFKEYYDKAKELYGALSNASGDTEMQLLNQMYNEAVENGWL